MKYQDHTGRKFDTFEQMCLYWNMNADTVQNRLKQGFTLEWALTKPTPSQLEYIDPETGVEFHSYRSIAKYYGIVECSLKKHVQKDKFSIARAIKIGLKNKATRQKRVGEVVDHKGDHYVNFRALAKAYKITYQTLYNRVFIDEWDIKKALTKPVKKQVKKCTKN